MVATSFRRCWTGRNLLWLWSIWGPLAAFFYGSQTQQIASVRKLKYSSSMDVPMSPTSPQGGSRVDLLPRLKDCDRPQSHRSLPELAKLYQPSKFWKYAHTSFDRFYPTYLEPYRTKYFRLLEIGLDTGQGSLLWAEYFPCATLIGLEFNTSHTSSPGASQLYKTIVGDQGNRTFLETDFLHQTEGGSFDVIIDDGGHHYEQQRTSYEVLFERALNPGGLYIIEDIETSYYRTNLSLYDRPISRGGPNEPNTIVNQFKQVVDVVNKKFFDNTYTVFGKMDQFIASVSFGSNLIVLEKKDQRHCFSERTYIWPKRLAEDCPARQQDSAVMRGSPMHKFCGDRILQRDEPGTREK